MELSSFFINYPLFVQMPNGNVSESFEITNRANA